MALISALLSSRADIESLGGMCISSKGWESLIKNSKFIAVEQRDSRDSLMSKIGPALSDL